MDLILEIDSTVSKDENESAITKFLEDFRSRFAVLNTTFKFGQMPFKKCVACEGSNHNLMCGDEILSIDVWRRMREWLKNALEMIHSEIITHGRDVGVVEIALSDDKRKYGFGMNVRLKDGNSQLYFTVIPVTEDICADKEKPYLFTLILRGDQQK